MFLGSTQNSGNVSSIFFHYGESVRYRRRLSKFLPSTCHFRFFTSSLMVNNCFNLGIIGKYHTILVGGLSLSSSPLFPLIFFLNYDKPHVKHAFTETNLSLYNTQSLEHACIFWYSKPIRQIIFFAS